MHCFICLQISLLYGLREGSCICSVVICCLIRKPGFTQVYSWKGRNILIAFRKLWIFFWYSYQILTNSSIRLVLVWNLSCNIDFPYYDSLKFIHLPLWRILLPCAWFVISCIDLWENTDSLNYRDLP